MTTVYGVDLGESCARLGWQDPSGGSAVSVGVPADGSPVLVPAVAFRGMNDRVTGAEALVCELPEESLRVRSVRRLLLAGTGASGSFDGSGAAVFAHGQEYPPEAVAEVVLRRLLQQSPFPSDPMADEAVVGAPVDCGLSAQDALRRAAQQADLYVSRMVFEPVAVAAHYGMLESSTYGVVVCDVGGARLEVSALAIGDVRVQIAHAVCLDLAEGLGTLDLISLAASTVRTVVDAARAAGLAGVETVLLAGGGLRAPEAAEALERQAGLAVRSQEPELAVVKGLVRYIGVGMRTVDNQWLNERRGAVGASLPGFVVPPPDVPVSARTPPPPPSDLLIPPPPPSDLLIPPPRVPDSLDTEPSASATFTASTSAAPTTPRFEPPPMPPPAASPRPAAPAAAPASPPPPAWPTAEARTAVPLPDPPSAALVWRAVDGLRAERREKEVLVTFAWPLGAETAAVRWRAWHGSGRPDSGGEATTSLRSYRHEGAVTLRPGLGEVEIEVCALVPDAFGAPGVGTVARTAVPAVRPVAHYVPELVGRGKQTARITVICEEDCVLPELAVVHGDGAHRPVRIGDGQVVHRIPGHPVRAGAPDVVEFPVGRLSGPAWLVCLALDQAAADADVIPLSLSRLKVR